MTALRPALLFFTLIVPLRAADFVNFEVPAVHPLDLSPDGSRLAVCHTADNRVLIYTLTAGAPVQTAAIFTGLDPVTVRWRTASELWVVNHISDTVSVIDVPRGVVLHSIQTADEPADVVFAGNPQQAWVSCSQVNRVQVFDPANPAAGVKHEITIEGEDPRALAVSLDGTKVYAAIYESGNGSTVLAGGGDGDTISFPPNAVSDSEGPYNGTNPPPNSGSNFVPARNTAAGTPPKVGLIVKKNPSGQWFDDNNRNWTPLVSGPQATGSGRPVGWDLIDNDVAIIDTATRSVSYVTRMMNLCMAIAVNPASGLVTVVGTDAINEVRFEPNLKGRFLRVRSGSFAPETPAAPVIADLNTHLTYTTGTIPQPERDRSLGDPRAIVWKADGSRGYVAGMGSNNVIPIQANGARIGGTTRIEAGQGPAGLAIDEARGRLYVLNRFEGSLSIVSLATETETSRLSFFDPTPSAIKNGRPFLYDTRRTSGLGHTSCASCHADARMDRLAWDLGDPAGDVKDLSASKHNQGGNIPGLNSDFTDFHPMKGPMTTQTMQDIIGKEPHHWRGDRDGLEEFNAAFTGLLGDDVALTPAEMQQFEDFLATIAIPPNPFRNMDNSLPVNLPLPGHYTTGRFAAAGQQLPAGNAQRALNTLYRPLARGIDRGAFACVTCHTLPTGMGMDRRLNGFSFSPIAPGPNGERHHALVSVDGSSQRAFKVPHLRNLYDKVGFETTQARSLAGFGFGHDGTIDSISRFMSEGAFEPNNDQEVADLVALMLAFSGSAFGNPVDALEPPGTGSLDAHAAAGRQALLVSASLPAAEKTRLDALIALANSSAIDLFAKASVNGVSRGWLFLNAGNFQTDQAGVNETLAGLLARASTTEPVLFTAAPRDTGRRMGIDRDRDGLFDYDEIRDLVPAVPGVQNPFRPDNPDATGNSGSLVPDGIVDSNNDFDGDGITNLAEFNAGSNPVGNLTAPAELNLTISSDTPFTSVTLTWAAEANAVYDISWSGDLVAWTLLSSGSVTAGPAAGPMTWTDSGPPSTPAPPSATLRRFYKVERVR